MTPIVVEAVVGGRTFKDLQDETLAYGFDDTRYRPRVKAWLNEGLRRVRRRIQLPESEASINFATTAGANTLELPSNFVRAVSLRDVELDQDLELVSQDTIDNSPDATGRPYRYAIFEFQIMLYPTPNKVYALAMRHITSGFRMVLDADIPGLPDDYRDLPISWALHRAYLAEDDAEMSNVHRQEFETELKLARSDLQYDEGNARHQQISSMWSSSVGPTFRMP